MKNYLRILATGIVMIACGNLYCQYTGPSSLDKFYTVKEIKDNASHLDKTDELVKVNGFVIRQLNKDTYEFKDESGIIIVDIDKKKLPTRPFDDKTELILIVEVDHDMLEPVEIEVEEIYFINP
jgi:uncharacterized protein (TIGR00156 family)